MRATIFLEVSFELSEPDDYPEDVQSWEEAALTEADGLQVSSEMDVIVTVCADRARIDGDDPFERMNEDAGDGAEG